MTLVRYNPNRRLTSLRDNINRIFDMTFPANWEEGREAAQWRPSVDIWTPLVEDLAESSGEGVDNFRSQLDAKHPIGHVGEPDDIAYGALYLASDESAFVTGSELVIDGGYTAQ